VTKPAKPDAPLTDDERNALDQLTDLVLRENTAIQRALADVKEQGVDEDVAVVVIEEHGRTSCIAAARTELRGLVSQLPLHLDDKIAEPAKPGQLWAVVYSVGTKHVMGMAMELVRVKLKNKA
jgi:hypothetical protein